MVRRAYEALSIETLKRKKGQEIMSFENKFKDTLKANEDLNIDSLLTVETKRQTLVHLKILRTKVSGVWARYCIHLSIIRPLESIENLIFYIRLKEKLMKFPTSERVNKDPTILLGIFD